MKSGIYSITSPSGRRYIGSAVDIERRWTRHRKDLRAGSHGNINLQRAKAKYGLESLRFSILIICDPINLLIYEQIAIDGLAPEYNIAPIAGSSLGIKRSDEFKARVSRGGKGRVVSAETRAKIGAKHKGKKLTPEHIQRWRAGLKPVSIEDRRQLAAFMHTPEAKAKKAIAMKGHAVSKVAREKISAANLGRRRTPTQIANIKAGIALARATALTLQNGA